jgi:hypothetical protein
VTLVHADSSFGGFELKGRTDRLACPMPKAHRQQRGAQASFRQAIIGRVARSIPYKRTCDGGPLAV